MDDIKVFGVLLTFVSAVNAEQCYYYDDSYYDDSYYHYSTNTMWCDNGCCGNMDNRYCCVNVAAGTIVGIVIGCICGVILIVSVVVAICCCLGKSKGQSGQVCQPAQSGVNVTYGVPNSTVAYAAPVGYNNTGFMQTTTMTAGTAIPQAPMQPNPYAQAPMQPNPYAQAPMQPNPYAEAPPKYEELNVPPQQQQPN